MKTHRIISIFILFALCFLTHFIYDIFPNTFTAIFFPVNESIWEHMKMLFTTTILYYFIEYIYLHFKNINFNNFIFSAFMSAILSIPIYLLLFLPIYYTIGENMPITLTLLFITIAIIQYINYKILDFKKIPYVDMISVFLIIVCFSIFGYLTFHPLKNDLFFDTKDEKYGINIYNI